MKKIKSFLSLLLVSSTALAGSLDGKSYGSILPVCEVKNSYVLYKDLPQDSRLNAKKMREFQRSHIFYSRAARRKQCPKETAIVDAVFKKLVTASKLQRYVSGEQSFYPLVNCDHNEINGYVNFGILVVSVGVVRQAANEGEIAALIGHEIGHHLLAHDLIEPAEVNQSKEFAADRVGLALLVAAGYSPGSMISLFKGFEPKGDVVHGTPAQRIENIVACIY